MAHGVTTDGMKYKVAWFWDGGPARVCGGVKGGGGANGELIVRFDRSWEGPNQELGKGLEPQTLHRPKSLVAELSPSPP